MENDALIQFTISAFTILVCLAVVCGTVMMTSAILMAKELEPAAFTKLVADGNGLRIVTVVSRQLKLDQGAA